MLLARISIHAPTRGATNPLSVLCSLAIIFQSTLPREERHFPYSCQYSIYNFNPRSHERSDQGTKLFKTLLYNFNPRSHERSDGHTSISSSCGNYFNPRSHERSDNPLSVLCSLAIIFQSTLPREERLYGRIDFTRHYNFNPRSHERSDHCALYIGNGLMIISIHAPTRGATLIRIPPHTITLISIHAPTRGATQIPELCQPGKHNFNPRSHERSDDVVVEYIGDVRISIHAPTRGATMQSTILIFAQRISIHAPTRGATVSHMHQIMPILISIHAPTRGATQNMTIYIPRLRFQSTLPREERLIMK